MAVVTLEKVLILAKFRDFARPGGAMVARLIPDQIPLVAWLFVYFYQKLCVLFDLVMFVNIFGLTLQLQ